MAALLWQAPDPSIYGFEAPKEGTPVNSDAYAIPINARPSRHRAAVHRLHAAARERREEHQLHRLPDARARHRGTYQEIVADYPECTVTVEDLARNLYFTNDSVAKTQARDAAYTEMKVGG